MTTAKKTGGLAGVAAGETSISTVGKAGVGLTYRGYTIEDLAEHASFAEVAYLLLHQKLPDQKQLTEFNQALVRLRDIPSELKKLLKILPATTHPMDVLRTGCSVLGNFEPEDEQHPADYAAQRLLAAMPTILMYWYNAHYQVQYLDIESDETSIAGYFLHLLWGKKPPQEIVRDVDGSMVLYAEHEFNASTFAARVTTATLSDLHSAVCSAIGTLRGSLHGGANEKAMELIESFSTPDAAEAGILKMLTDKEKIMGFGHRVYQNVDPRSVIIKVWTEKLAQSYDKNHLFPIAERIEQVMWREKKLFPNLDFYAAPMYHFCKIPTVLFTPIFVLARLSGWIAHCKEQRANNRLIRPAADYIGPLPRKFTTIEDR